MKTEYDKYNSTPFLDYFIKKNGYDIIFDNDRNRLKINDANVTSP
jgi:hypothetical protein